MDKAATESVPDPAQLLQAQDHMQGMERLDMRVETVSQPYPSVRRVTGTISPSDPKAWNHPNLAVRLEVETPEGERPVSRVYTVRAFDEATNQVEIDFVIHTDDSPAMRWLATAKAGVSVYLVGPRPHFLPHLTPDGEVAMFADDTALPAVYAILTHWPQGARGTLYVETDDPEAFAALPKVAGVEAHLLRRMPGTAGRAGHLVTAARTFPLRKGLSIWAAGEREEIRAIRRHFTEVHGLSRDTVRVFGYWRKGISSSQIDRERLSRYEAMRQGGEGVTSFEDLDLSI